MLSVTPEELHLIRTMLTQAVAAEGATLAMLESDPRFAMLPEPARKATCDGIRTAAATARRILAKLDGRTPPATPEVASA